MQQLSLHNSKLLSATLAALGHIQHLLFRDAMSNSSDVGEVTFAVKSSTTVSRSPALVWFQLS